MKNNIIIGIDGNEANQKNRVGIGQFAFNIISQLEKIDKENQYFIYLKEKPLSDLPKERPGWQYKIFGPSKFWTQGVLPIKLFTQREKLDVFYSPSHYAPRFSPFPIIISIMDLWHHYHPEQFAKKDLYQLINWERYSVRKASRIVTISEFSKSEIIKFYNYPANRIIVAYPGYTSFDIKNKNEKISKLDAEAIKNTKKKYKIEGNYLLYLGTLQPKKNLLGLIEAFKVLITNYQLPITLVISGKKGWLYEEIFRKVKELELENKVIFTDFIEESEKPYLILGAKCFVMPSFYEGFGIPVLEAMSLGIPVAISNTSSLPEIGGKAAFYFNPENPPEIAQTILRVIKLSQSEREKVTKAGFNQAKKFSWEKCAGKVLKSIKSIRFVKSETL